MRIALLARRFDPEGGGTERDLMITAECLRRAEELLAEGRRVLIDANFREERRRSPFLELGMRLCVPALLLLCRASPEVVKARLASRRADASDADWDVHRKLATDWEEPGPTPLPFVRDITTDDSPGDAVSQSIRALEELGLTRTDTENRATE